MKRGGKATVRNPVAKAVRGIKPSVVKPKKGKGSYTRKVSSFSSGGAAKVRSAGKEYMTSIRAKTPETGVKAKARRKAAKEKIEKDLNKARKGFATPARQAEMKSGGSVKKKIDKVVKGLKKASKSHAGQAKTLSSLKFREGGSTTKKKSKVKTPKGTKGFKGIQPLRITAMRKTSKYESGGKTDKAKRGKVDKYKTTNPRYSGLKTGSIMQRAMTKDNVSRGAEFNAPFASASPAEARDEKQRSRAKNKRGSNIGDALKTATAPLKKEKAKDTKRVADIKRRQKVDSAVRKTKSAISRRGRTGGGKSATGLGIRPTVLGPTRKLKMLKSGGKTKSTVNKAGNYTKPGLRKRIFNRIKAGGKGGAPGQWSARKAQMMAQAYKKAGGGYKD